MLTRVQVPASSSTINVCVIDNGSFITGMQGSDYMSPVLAGFEVFDGPSYAFLLHHEGTGTRLLFDLGIRTNWRTAYAPDYIKELEDSGMGIHVERDIVDLLHEHGISSSSDIEAIIFSHHHFDHTGDTTSFSPSTKLVVGPGYKDEYLPGFPNDPNQIETTSDLYEGREVLEMDFSPSDPNVSTIGGFLAYDYFSDGSLYLLSTPGHTIGHISALARTTSHDQESTFIFLGGDIVSSNAVLRPSQGIPLPYRLHTSKEHERFSTKSLASLHRCHSSSQGNDHLHTTPFCLVSGEEDNEESQRNADKLRVFDSEEDIFVIWAHDTHLKDILPIFPVRVNSWKSTGLKERAHWRWLEPCIRAVSQTKSDA